MLTFKSQLKGGNSYRTIPGAITGEGDRKRAPFLVLGLSLSDMRQFSYS